MTRDDLGSKIQMKSGRYVDPFDIQPDDIVLADIAHSLSHLCRFTGACSRFYSVAEHSLLVSDLVPRELKLAALLHDAAEAYFGDVARPLKERWEYDFIRDAETHLLGAIESRFGLVSGSCSSEEIKEADLMALAIERRDLMPRDGIPWPGVPSPRMSRSLTNGSWISSALIASRFAVRVSELMMSGTLESQDG